MKTTQSSIKPKEIPGGFIFRIGRDPFQLFRTAAKKYGDICYITGGKSPIYLINNPDYIYSVLVANHKNFQKKSPLKFLGNGLITSNGDFHYRQKQLIQPAFHHERVASYGNIMVDYTRRLCSEWKDGQVLEMNEQMMQLTLEIVAKCLFGADLEDKWKEIRDAASTIVEYLNRSTGPIGMVMRRLHIAGDRRYLEAVKKFDAVIYEIINERKKKRDSDSNDLLSVLLRAHDEHGETMSEEQLRDEAITLMFAGHETTAHALTWTSYLIASNPEVEAKLHNELDKAFPNKELPTAADLNRLQYARRVFTETLRMYPSVRLIPRFTISDYNIDGYHIPADSLVMMSPFLIHHDRRFYKDPERFDPDRWTPEMEAELPDFAYFPFGGGPRRCAGEPFAWMEAILIIATISRSWRFTLIPGRSYGLERRISSRPKNGMTLKISKR